jgi:RNA 2',3'-cyclic 3'-phosphodiesterase
MQKINSMRDSFRGFIAIKIPKDIESVLGLYQEALKREGLKCKWVHPENIHITLLFLGNIDLERALNLSEDLNMELSSRKPIEVSISSVGFFPNIKNPSVFWAGINKGAGELKDLKKSIEAISERHGFGPEDRDFKAHLTIARFKDRRHVDSKALESICNRDKNRLFGQFEAKEVIFFKSILKPSGPEYYQFQTFKLAQ